MTDNEKIARWAGLGNWLDFKNKDQDAVLLLPILASKRYAFQLHGWLKYQLDIYVIDENGNKTCVHEDDETLYTTISAAITAAILQLIDYKP